MENENEPIQFPNRDVPDQAEKDWPAELHAVHEKHLGKDFLIHDGKPEKGHGSKFSLLHPAHKAHIAAIEHLIAMEAEHAQAEGALAAAHLKVEHARKQVEATEKASSEVKE